MVRFANPMERLRFIMYNRFKEKLMKRVGIAFILMAVLFLASCSQKIAEPESPACRITVINLNTDSYVYWELIKASETASERYKILSPSDRVIINTDEDTEYTLYAYGETDRYATVAGVTVTEVVSVTPLKETHITTNKPFNMVYLEVKEGNLAPTVYQY